MYPAIHWVMVGDNRSFWFSPWPSGSPEQVEDPSLFLDKKWVSILILIVLILLCARFSLNNLFISSSACFIKGYTLHCNLLRSFSFNEIDFMGPRFNVQVVLELNVLKDLWILDNTRYDLFPFLLSFANGRWSWSPCKYYFVEMLPTFTFLLSILKTVCLLYSNWSLVVLGQPIIIPRRCPDRPPWWFQNQLLSNVSVRYRIINVNVSDPSWTISVPSAIGKLAGTMW